MKRFLLLCFLTIWYFYTYSQNTVCISKNSTSPTTYQDNQAALWPATTAFGSVNYAITDFTSALGALAPGNNPPTNPCIEITDVNIRIFFRKRSGGTASTTLTGAAADAQCAANGALGVFQQEIGFVLAGPAGAGGNVILAQPQAAAGGASWPGNTTTNATNGVTFDQQGGAFVAAYPPGYGAMQPAVGNLNTYNGNYPVGAWTLNFIDDTSLDGLCIFGFDITICAKVTFIEDLTTCQIPGGSAAGATTSMCENGTPPNIFDFTVNTNVEAGTTVQLVRSAANGGPLADPYLGTALAGGFSVSGPATNIPHGGIAPATINHENLFFNNVIFPENNTCIDQVYNVYAIFSPQPVVPGAPADACKLWTGPITVTISPNSNIAVSNPKVYTCEDLAPTVFSLTDANGCAATPQWIWLDKPTGLDGATSATGIHSMGPVVGTGNTFAPPQFADPGFYRYAVTKEGVAGTGCRDTAYAVLVVAPKPTIRELEALCDRTVQIHLDEKMGDSFIAEGLSWVYQFDAPVTTASTQFTTEQTLTTAMANGTHTINVGVRCATCGAGGTPALLGCTNSMNVNVYETPIAAIVPSVTSVCAGTAVTFTNNTTENNGGAALTDFHWDFGDGTATVDENNVINGSNQNHTFPNPGVYTVELSTTNNEGTNVLTDRYATCTHRTTTIITVVPNTDIVELESLCDRTIQIHMSSTPPSGHSWVYAIDALPTATSNPFTTENVITVATSTGNHTINAAIACNTCGAGGTPALVGACIDNMAIGVYETPVADIVPSVTTVCAGTSVAFTNNTTENNGGVALTDFHWDFGDGTATVDENNVINGSNQNHTFPNPGVYTVELSATNNEGANVLTDRYATCTHRITTIITVVGFPELTLDAHTDVTCNGGSDGSATVSFNPPLPAGATFLWNNGGGTAQNTSTLTSGVATLTVTYPAALGGCSKAYTVVNIENPPAITLTIAGVNPGCNGSNTGSIDLTAQGGTGAHTYQWSGSSTAITEDLIGLAAGTYNILVTDVNSCSANTTVTLTNPSALSASQTNTAETCALNDGTINLSPSGGTAPYTFTWSNGATTEDLTGLPSGVYGVCITDASGCSYSISNIALIAPNCVCGTPTNAGSIQN